MSPEPLERSARKRSSSFNESLADQLPKRPKKSVACKPCHSRKVKCSGGEPCSNCRQAKCTDRCEYPVRDQKVTVSNRYIEQLLAENERLREQSALGKESRHHRGGTDDSPSSDGEDTATADKVAEQGGISARNPLLGEKGWFYPLGSHGGMPVHIGEAADTAFATRFRQSLVENPNLKHMPRLHHVSDDSLTVLANRECPWPPLPRARLLIRTALESIGSCYHCVRRSAVYDGLSQHYINGGLTSSSSYSCKLWGLFALGEVYSSRQPCTGDGDFPGLPYFAQATRIANEFHERPSLDTIEVLLLLSLYSLLMNRRYNAYLHGSTAVRLGVILGLNHDMAEHHFPDRAAREHRTRVWWTAYILDRLVASKMGHAVSIQDDEITAQLPSDQGLTDTESKDFLDAEYMKASIRLAGISRDIMTSIYNRKATHPFSQRVQKALSDLRGWVRALPAHLQVEQSDGGERPIARRVKWLHLTFNQFVIIATRPILLHVFRTHKQLWISSARNNNNNNNNNDQFPPPPSSPSPSSSSSSSHPQPVQPQQSHLSKLKSTIGETTLALAEACIRCARHSNHILTTSWIDGSLAIFDYTYTQYFFASASILAVSSLTIGRDSPNQEDRDGFEQSYQFLAQMRRSGNYASTEFCRHLDAIRGAMGEFRRENGLLSEEDNRDGGHEGGGGGGGGGNIGVGGSSSSSIGGYNGNMGGGGGGGSSFAAVPTPLSATVSASSGAAAAADLPLSAAAAAGTPLQAQQAHNLQNFGGSYGGGGGSINPTHTSSNNNNMMMTAEMALAEPSLQDFLSQADLDLGFLDTQMQASGDFQSLYVSGTPISSNDQSWFPGRRA